MYLLIRDINLATEGRKKFDWVSNFYTYIKHIR